MESSQSGRCFGDPERAGHASERRTTPVSESRRARYGRRAVHTDRLLDALERQVQRSVLRSLPTSDRELLVGLDLSSLLIVQLTWCQRQIARAHRRVHESREMRASPARPQYSEAIAQITHRLRTGGDLGPYLSKASAIAIAGPGHRAESDKDRLLAEWGVHHLHLGTRRESDGRFVERTRDLLFVHVGLDDAYLIGIYPHGAWARAEIAEVIVRNWGEIGPFRAARSVIGLAQEPPTEEERLRLRNAGLTVAIEVDGLVYMPMGQSSAGTPLPAAIEVNRFMHELERWRGEYGREQLEQHRAFVAAREPLAAHAPWTTHVAGGECFLLKGAAWRLPVARLPRL